MCVCERLSGSICGYNINAIVPLVVDGIDLDRSELPLGVHSSSHGEAIDVVRRGKTIKLGIRIYLLRAASSRLQFRFERMEIQYQQ